MQGNSYSTLSDAINQIIPPSTVLTQLFFPASVNETIFTDTIEVDLKNGKRRIAPFGSVHEASKSIKRDGSKTRLYRLPFISIDTFLSSYDLNTQRLVGTNMYLGKGVSLEGIKKQKIADALADLKNSITNRIELMVAQALTGEIDVTGENVNYTIDYGMSSDNKPVYTGNNVWGGSTSDIAGNIKNWKRIINRATGLSANIGLMGYEAADKFMKDTEVLKQLNNNNFKAGTLTIEGLDYLGKYAGIEWYERAEQYTNLSGTLTEYINPKQVILHASASVKKMYYGPVYDEAVTAAVPIFVKEEITVDPSGRKYYAKTSPLPVFEQPDATVVATVLEA